MFRKIKAALDAEDIEGLLQIECPRDEYDGEASEIESDIARLTDFGKRSATVSELAEIVASVWERKFGPFSSQQLQQRRAAFVAVAIRIAE